MLWVQQASVAQHCKSTKLNNRQMLQQPPSPSFQLLSSPAEYTLLKQAPPSSSQPTLSAYAAPIKSHDTAYTRIPSYLTYPTNNSFLYTLLLLCTMIPSPSTFLFLSFTSFIWPSWSIRRGRSRYPLLISHRLFFLRLRKKGKSVREQRVRMWW